MTGALGDPSRIDEASLKLVDAKHQPQWKAVAKACLNSALLFDAIVWEPKMRTGGKIRGHQAVCQTPVSQKGNSGVLGRGGHK